jgi:cell division septal protein FtsQ
MTTLDVRIKTLQMAVAPFPVVKALHVSTQFPHGVRISVVEEAPVGVITAGGSSVAVAADGTLLPSATSTANLPQIPVRVPPGGSRVSDPGTRAVVALLAAAPWQLLAHVAQASQQPGHGLVALLRNGPAIYFGTDSQLTAKWAAAAAVLADARSAGAQYIDVSDPGRPAAGTTTTSSTTTGSTAATATGSTGATTTPNGGTITPPAASAAGASAAGTTGAPAAASPTGGG